MKTLLLTTILASTTALAAPAPAKESNTRVAVINMQKAIQSVADGKKAQETLKREWDDRNKKLSSEGEKVKAAMEDLRKKAMVMDEKSRREKEEAIQAQIMKLREAEAQNGAEFQKRDQEISGPIIEKMRNIVAQISKDKGYNLVIDQSNVIYALDQDDITAEVIKRYDSKK